MKNTFADLIASGFSSDTPHLNQLPADDPRVGTITEMSDAFTDGVEILRHRFPNPRINTLMKMVWDLVGGHVVPVVHGMPVKVLSIGVVVTPGGELQARIFMPDDYLEMVTKDPFYQLGGLVYIGSQAVDFWNGKITRSQPDGGVFRRAHAYEAEFLHSLAKETPWWHPNKWQKRAMKDFPKGLDSPGVHLYEYKRVPPSEPVA